MMKKRTLIVLTCVAFVLCGCSPRLVSEAKAKEIALKYINQVFDADETEAVATREQMECYTDQAGALATSGDSEFSARWVYFVRVKMAETMTKYEAYVVASTGEVIYANQHSVNIIMSDEQRDQAEKLYSEETIWGEKHAEAFQALHLACYDWAIANLEEPRPIVLEANSGQMPDGAVQREFTGGYYVVTRDGRVYALSMSWPSLQVLSISLISES